jgi:hypothetical protein
MGVLNVIAQVADLDVMDLTPLYESIDPEAIDRLFGHGSSDETVLSFRHEHWNVFLRGDGHIRICDATEEVEAAPVFERPMD